MKRNLLLLLAGLLLSTVMEAAPVDMEQARRLASRFLMERSESRAPVVLQRVSLQDGIARRSASVTDGDLLYVFNAARTQGGYVVVSGDDRTPAILAYSDEGSLTADAMPEAMRGMLESYARQIAYMADHNVQNAPRRAAERQKVAAMVTTAWDQSAPYNQKCPVDTRNNQRSATGCVATALAQLMNYHKYPQRTLSTIPAYTTWSLKLSVDAIEPTDIDWDNMRPNYRTYSTAAQKEAVATLMFLIGASVGMDYSATGSGASSASVEPAVRDCFGYTGARLLSRDDYTLDEWEDLIYREMVTNGPVYLAGQSAGGGHAFLIDGYDKDGYFHVNWGWSGTGSDYCLLSVLNPYNTSGLGSSTTEDGFSYAQDILAGMNPAVTTPAQGMSLTASSMRVYGRSSLQRNASGNFAIQARTMLYNMNYDDANFEYGLAIVDANGNRVAETKTGSRVIGGLTGYEFTLTCATNLADGQYKAVAISRQAGTTKWEVCGGSLNYFLGITVSGDNATLTSPTISIEGGEWTATGNTAPGSLIPLRIRLTNNGSDFYRDVMLMSNGKVLAGRRLDLKAGETKDFDIDFGTDTEGTMFLQLCYESDRSMVPFAQAALLVSRKGGGIVDGQRLLTLATNIIGLSGDVMKANAEGASTVTVTANVTNRGSADYNDSFGADLLDAEGNMLRTVEQKISLKVNDYVSTQLVFDNVPNEASYQVKVWYKDTQGAKVFDEQDFAFSITPFTGIEHNLAIKMTLSNLNTRTKKLTNANPHLTLQITNKGSYDYNDRLLVRVCKIVDRQPVDIGKNYDEQLQLPVGDKVEREYDFTGLVNGEVYAVMADYVTEGQLTSLLNYLDFIVDDPNADAVRDIVAHIGADRMITVCDLSGRQVARVRAALLEQTLRQLPKAVYVVEGAKMYNDAR